MNGGHRKESIWYGAYSASPPREHYSIPVPYDARRAAILHRACLNVQFPVLLCPRTRSKLTNLINWMVTAAPKLSSFGAYYDVS